MHRDSAPAGPTRGKHACDKAALSDAPQPDRERNCEIKKDAIPVSRFYARVARHTSLFPKMVQHPPNASPRSHPKILVRIRFPKKHLLLDPIYPALFPYCLIKGTLPITKQGDRRNQSPLWQPWFKAVGFPAGGWGQTAVTQSPSPRAVNKRQRL